MGNYNGALTAAQIITETDGWAAVLATCYSALGLGVPGENGTASAAANALKTLTVGDGTSSNPGLGNIYAQNISPSLDGVLNGIRWDSLIARLFRTLVSAADAQILQNVPSGWTFTSSTYPHLLNNQLLRSNAAHTGVPGTPATAGTLTSTNVAGGALPVVVSGSAPRVVHTLVGTNKWDESLPCPEATQVAIAGNNNSYTYQVAGTVPVGVTALNLYRGLVGGVAGTYYLDQTIVVTPGSAYPAVIISKPDSTLRQDWLPPAWLSCLIKPETSAIIGLAYSTQGFQVTSGPNFTAANMVTPQNTALNPGSLFQGRGNPSGSQIFGTTVIGTGFTPGSFPTVNNATNGVQGFAGTTKLQCRVTSVMNANAGVSLTYSYYDAAHGFGTAQTATITGTFGAATVGTVLTLSVPAGRLVYAVTADSPSIAASGTYVIEAQSIR